MYLDDFMIRTHLLRNIFKGRVSVLLNINFFMCLAISTFLREVINLHDDFKISDLSLIYFFFALLNSFNH